MRQELAVVYFLGHQRVPSRNTTLKSTFSSYIVLQQDKKVPPRSLKRLFLQEGLASLDLAQPTDVQRAALPLILGGHNTAIQWYTGSGKVCHFDTSLC